MKYINGMVRHNGGRSVIAVDGGPTDLGERAWNPMVLVNGWRNYGGDYGTARFRKLSNGLVEVQALIQSGTANVITTLPPGYRPGQKLRFPAVTHPNAPSAIDVNTTGVVNVVEGYYNNTWLTLYFIFTADQ